MGRFRFPDDSPSSECFFQPLGASRCYHRRTCEECLRMPGCMLNQYGECVSQVQDGYNPTIDFRVAQAQNLTMPNASDSVLPPSQLWHFPALEAAYCTRNDSVCGSWMATQRFDGNETIDSRYCVGTAQRRRDARADAAATGANERLERPVQRRADVDTVDASVPRAPLDLSGWRVQHAERIENEKLRLAGAGDVNVSLDLQQSVAEVEREREEEEDEDEDASTSYVRVEDRTNTTAPSA
ncbi:hypothetical protein P43SY_001601 [Pythium insidiosum]|uniref:Uncharacterized protein n=1 Tax=Pythium insidiosum TaxID=114742 RepID=A0AAD5QB98_PYTIN|nr:hypothetical protein P43SY_001601 [Pythium insidiosum]